MTPTYAAQDRLFMLRALAEARLGLGRVEPNPMVGAVLVKDGRLLSVGHHDRFGGPHAEIHALSNSGSSARGASLYVTLEPCCHTGKTPPCVDAILRAGVTRVVAAMRDPFPRVAGGGFARLSEAGVEVEVGIEEQAARTLNAPYLKRLTTGRPYVIAKWAMTLDGKTAVRGGQSQWISGPRSRALVHELRGRVDGLISGIGTVLADDPLLTARPAGPRQAVRVVLDSSARLPLSSRLVQTAGECP
ncbi:MAG TPA: bifunctional diaminohydroxyphosphoribosylaminopyrimidine deaminase/5-amino-6-(5-phosphoribosylamino)uracil reductase RibD, partial [Isosphaeraceae bacterium]|nr:bifunctional diaminohydroxyphosphoribosylaminopyrimidine deaminase/5-amino-6-(5-phosphoribosylamino)uracil reductase RibD [Isosphaeraceae bacterium]